MNTTTTIDIYASEPGVAYLARGKRKVKYGTPNSGRVSDTIAGALISAADCTNAKAFKVDRGTVDRGFFTMTIGLMHDAGTGHVHGIYEATRKEVEQIAKEQPA